MAKKYIKELIGKIEMLMNFNTNVVRRLYSFFLEVLLTRIAVFVSPDKVCPIWKRYDSALS